MYISIQFYEFHAYVLCISDISRWDFLSTVTHLWNLTSVPRTMSLDGKIEVPNVKEPSHMGPDGPWVKTKHCNTL